MELKQFYFQIKQDGYANVQGTCDELMLFCIENGTDKTFTCLQKALLTAVIAYISRNCKQSEWKVETVVKHLKEKCYEEYQDTYRLVTDNLEIYNLCDPQTRNKVYLSVLIPLMYAQVNKNPEHTKVKIKEGQKA